MNNKGEKICRLCLKAATNGYYAEIDEVISQLFHFLLLKLDLNITRGPIICYDCVENCKKCLKFKLTCFNTERIILSFFADKKTPKYNIKTIYRGREDVETTTDEYLDICRICMTRSKRNNFDHLDSLRNGKTLFEILSKCVSEMDINFIENSMICTTCKENLENYYKFVMNCLDIEEKIKLICKKMENDNMDHVNLEYIQHFVFKDILQFPEKCLKTYAIKEELNMFEDTNFVHAAACSRLIKLEELDIKEEKNYMEENTCKTLTKTFNKDLITNTSASETDIFPYTQCASEKKRRRVLRNQTDKVVSQRKDKNYKMHKCSLCAFETKHKSNMNHHMLVHKNISEIEMYKCSFCDFKTKRKRSIKYHIIIHKDVSELKMHKCSLCAYEAKHKSNLQRHMLVHKDVSEIKMQKCSLCAYETKQKYNLREHMLIHKDISERPMLKCSLCSYQAKQKRSLKNHFLVHKDVSEITNVNN